MQQAAERFGQFAIGDRVGRNEVDRADQRFVGHDVNDRRDHVVDRDPAHELTSVADLAAQPLAERAEHLLERAALGAEHDAEPQQHDAQTLILLRGHGRRLPIAANLGQKAAAGLALFGQQLVAAVAVIADGRRAQKSLGRILQPGQRFGQKTSTVDAAVANTGLLGFGPAARGDVLARQMNDRVGALQLVGLDRAAVRIPMDFGLDHVRRRPHQPHDVDAAGGQRSHQG